MRRGSNSGQQKESKILTREFPIKGEVEAVNSTQEVLWVS